MDCEGMKRWSGISWFTEKQRIRYLWTLSENGLSAEAAPALPRTHNASDGSYAQTFSQSYVNCILIDKRVRQFKPDRLALEYVNIYENAIRVVQN